jgi:uroporphyrinogen-III decarboxylase
MAEKSPEELYKERDQRLADAIDLKVPDRVPIDMSFGYFPARYTNQPFSIVYYEPQKWCEAVKKTVVDFQPDSLFYIQGLQPGKALEKLDPKTQRWPGHGVSENTGNQAIEGEFMKADEYDLVMKDSTNFTLRYMMPRTVGSMEAWANFPDFSDAARGQMGAMMLAEALARPDLAASIATLQEVGREIAEWRKTLPDINAEVEELGFPVGGMGAGGSPYDQVMNGFRGMPGTMTDMYRQPDRLHELIDYFLQTSLKRIAAMPYREHHKRSFMATHRGSDGFMSHKQFEEFYWPGLKAIILAAIDKGIIPCIFFEGDWTTRIEYLLELPKGRIMAHFDSTDIFRAKDILKGHMCIRGNFPGSLLTAGTPDEVKEHVKKLIDYVGKDGGYVMCPRVVPDFAKPENLHAMIDYTKEYGVYR